MNIHYGFTIPAEWKKHERTFIQWPVKDSLIYPENYKEVCNGYAQVINAISQFEPLTIIVNEDASNYAKILCNGEIDIIKIPHNDGWIRDIEEQRIEWGIFRDRRPDLYKAILTYDGENGCTFR